MAEYILVSMIILGMIVAFVLYSQAISEASSYGEAVSGSLMLLVIIMFYSFGIYIVLD